MSNEVTVAGQNYPALPTYLKAGVKGANESVRSGLREAFIVPPKLSIEGKVFRVIKDDATIPITTKDEEGNSVPVSSLNVVIVGANAGKYKVFYGKQDANGEWSASKYNPNATEAVQPTCYSYDGDRPSPYGRALQSETCATCPQNEFGSLVNDLGNKTRACSDNKLLAVIPVSTVKKMSPANSPGAEAYLLKVSATALSRSKVDRKEQPANTVSLVEYVDLLNAFPTADGPVELPMTSVVTRLFFEVAKYPLLRFKLAKDPWLTPEQAAYVAERAEGEDVKAIVSEQGQKQATIAPAKLTAAQVPAKALEAPKKAPIDPEDAEVDLGAAYASVVKPEEAKAPVRRGRGAAKIEKLVSPELKAELDKPEPAQVASSSIDDELAKVSDMFGS